MRLKPLVDVVVDHKNVNSALVVDGYQCIDRSLNKVTRGGALGTIKHPCPAQAGLERGQGKAHGKMLLLAGLSTGAFLPSLIHTEHETLAHRTGQPPTPASA